MLRIVLAAAVAITCCAFVAVAQNKKDDKKDDKKTLEGTLTCTKCALKETDKCGNALIVEENKKKVTYYLVDKGAKAPYHGQICTEDKPAKVTGKVVEKDKKMTIEDPKVEIKK